MNGLNLEFVSDQFKQDKEVVLIAVTQNALSLRFAAQQLTTDKEFLLICVNHNKDIFR